MNRWEMSREEFLRSLGTKTERSAAEAVHEVFAQSEQARIALILSEGRKQEAA